MGATCINCLAIVAGSLLGILLRRVVRDGYREIVMAGTGFVTLAIAVQMAIQCQDWLVMVLAVIVGGLVGTALGIERRVYALGERLQALVKDGGGTFATGFLNASVLFCTGAMAIVGSIQAGTTGDWSLLLVKSVMDGSLAIAMAASWGPGTAFSALSVLVYQGFFTLAGAWLEPALGDAGILAMSTTGGALLVMVGMNLLGVRKTKVGDFLPAIVFAPVFQVLSGVFSSLH